MVRRLWRMALLAAVLLGSWWFENCTIETEVYELASDRLPMAFDGFRVVELADLHGRAFGREDQRLLDAVRAAQPDLIAIDGDLAGAGTDLSRLGALLPKLAKIAPTYYVTGNHEWAMDGAARRELFELLEASGVHALHNEYVALERDGAQIVVAGVDDPNGPWDQKTPETLIAEIREEQGDPFLLLLAHRNDQLPRWAALQLDAVLCGHAHGGVVRLPFVGGLIGPGLRLFPSYTAGVYREGRTAMLVSRGLGWSSAPLRLFNRPQLPVLVLRAGKP